MEKSGSTDSLRMQPDSNVQNQERRKQYCLSTAYLAPVEYYALLASAENILLEQHDFFIKQTYRNRCSIATANGLMDLTIPTEKSEGNKTRIKDVRISNHGNWRVNHWRSITSAYQSSPFFEYYADDFIPFFEKEWDFLWDYNLALQNKVLELLDIKPVIQFTDSYIESYGRERIDLREIIHPKKSAFFPEFRTYYQVFSQKYGFQQNLSIIDLLFNMGNESILVLKSF
jgi:hypothetical protein